MSAADTPAVPTLQAEIEELTETVKQLRKDLAAAPNECNECGKALARSLPVYCGSCFGSSGVPCSTCHAPAYAGYCLPCHDQSMTRLRERGWPPVGLLRPSSPLPDQTISFLEGVLNGCCGPYSQPCPCCSDATALLEQYKRAVTIR